MAFDAMSLTTPTKAQQKIELIDDARRSFSPESEDGTPEPSSSKKWVGEVHLPEREYLRDVVTRCDVN